MSKKEQLEKLAQEMAADPTLPLREANLVFGEGNPDAQVLFIGEAPGQKEDELKRPFVGRSGQLMRTQVREIGWKEEDVYITNIVKRRPPDNRDPLPEEIEAYRPYLARQIEIIMPPLIATLGRFSMNYFLPNAKISRDHGTLFILPRFAVYPLFHPAAALRGTEVLNLFKADFKKLPKVLEKIQEEREKKKASIPPPQPQQEGLF